MKFTIRILNKVPISTHHVWPLTANNSLLLPLKTAKHFILSQKAVSILEKSYSKGSQQTGEVGRRKHHKVQEQEKRSLAATGKVGH